MSDPMPKDAPALMLAQAELTDLRWVGLHLLREHRRGAYPHQCLCPVCKAAGRWIPQPTDDPMLPSTVQFSHAARR